MRLAVDAPAIETALAKFGGVGDAKLRDAAVLDFPDRSSGTGLYLFLEADRDLREEDVQGFLGRTVGSERLPEFVQIVDELPRRPDGTVRRDLLRLVSTNQVDLIEPLIASEKERRIVERIVAERKNLYGAPTIAAALTSHPQVRDAAVLAYPDRLCGTGLYAFVESSAVGEDGLADYVAGRVGRANMPKYIQVVPALPRNAAGQIRTDILQLVATNQVDTIDALITSDAERATVDRILNARHNMRDRFVL